MLTEDELQEIAAALGEDIDAVRLVAESLECMEREAELDEEYG